MLSAGVAACAAPKMLANAAEVRLTAPTAAAVASTLRRVGDEFEAHMDMVNLLLESFSPYSVHCLT